MGFANIQDVRDLVGLPDKVALPDSKIEFQLASGKRKVEREIGDYSTLTGTDRAQAKEAEICYTAYYGLTTWNTFFTSNIPGMQKELGELDFQLLSPEQLKEVRSIWLDRGDDSINILKQENSDTPILDMRAI